jgi:hypothetical protein
MINSKESFAVTLKRVLRRIYIGKSELIGARQIVRLIFLLGVTISLAATPFQAGEVQKSTVAATPSETSAPSETPAPEADLPRGEEKAATEKAATEKAAPPKIVTTSEKLAGFDAAHIRSFKTIISNIRAYISAVDSGNTVRSSQVCDLLDDNYNGSLRGVSTRSSNKQVQDLLDFAKDSMYAGVVDCTKGFRKNRVDLIGDSVGELVLATKYLDGLVMVSQVK